MSIPDWSYDESYYRALTKGTGLQIQTHPVKGKGLFADKTFSVGDRVLTETALCCTQNVDEVLRQAPACANCLVSLETPARIVARVTGNRGLAQELPHLEHFRPVTKVYCRNRAQGCTSVFCSARCADTAWKDYHYVGCVGNMSPEQKKVYHDFVQSNWEQGGVDYSDTHFFAFRFICVALSRFRLQSLPLPMSYAPIGQLIRAPLKKFNFTFLLSEDDTVEQKYESFLKYKEHPWDHPAVLEVSEDLSKEDMLLKGLGQMCLILGFTPEEKEFFTVERWSELLGAVLLNGQERTPNSPFTDYTEWLQRWPEGTGMYKSMKKNLGGSSVVSNCHTSSKGQGIYTIGACFNHSCEPNLQILYTESNDETLVAICIRDIAPGDECTISYINEELPYFERHQQLFEHYLFDCDCCKCGVESKLPRTAGTPSSTQAEEENEDADASADSDSSSGTDVE